MKNFLKKQETLERQIASTIRFFELKYHAHVESIAIDREIDERLELKHMELKGANLPTKMGEKFLKQIMGFINFFELKQRLIVMEIHVAGHERGESDGADILIGIRSFE